MTENKNTQEIKGGYQPLYEAFTNLYLLANRTEDYAGFLRDNIKNRLKGTFAEGDDTLPDGKKVVENILAIMEKTSDKDLQKACTQAAMSYFNREHCSRQITVLPQNVEKYIPESSELKSALEKRGVSLYPERPTLLAALRENLGTIVVLACGIFAIAGIRSCTENDTKQTEPKETSVEQQKNVQSSTPAARHICRQNIYANLPQRVHLSLRERV